MIHVIEWNFVVIFCFLTSRKCVLFLVDKTTIQVFEKHLKAISYLLPSPKFDLDKIVKTMFQLLPWQFEII